MEKQPVFDIDNKIFEKYNQITRILFERNDPQPSKDIYSLDVDDNGEEQSNEEEDDEILYTIINFLKDDFYNFEWFLRIIVYFYFIRPRQLQFTCKMITRIFDEFPDYKEYTIKYFEKMKKFGRYPNELCKFLASKEIIEFSDKNCIWIYPKNSFHYYLLTDDIENFRMFYNDETQFTEFFIPLDGRLYFECSIKVTLIEAAAYYGSINIFKYLWMLNAPFTNDKITKTAVAGGNIEIVKTLELDGFSFYDCIYTAIRYQRFDLIEWLSSKYPIDEWTLIQTATHYNCFLPLSYISFNQAKRLNYAELMHLAAEHGSLPIMKYFIECMNIDKEIKLRADRKVTPLYTACVWDNVDIVRYLFETAKADPNPLDFPHHITLTICAEKNSIFSMKYLIEKANLDPNLVLHSCAPALVYAARYNNFEMLKYLTEHGANIDAISKYEDRTALHTACSNGSVEIVDYLLSKNANINITDANHLTPLQVAMQGGYTNIAERIRRRN